MICKACAGEIPEGRRGRFCSEWCRRRFEGAGAGSAESGAPRSPAPDFNRQVQELPPLTAAELREFRQSELKARYRGTCGACGGAIAIGHRIRYGPLDRLQHVDCGDPRKRRENREDA